MPRCQVVVPLGAVGGNRSSASSQWPTRRGAACNATPERALRWSVPDGGARSGKTVCASGGADIALTLIVTAAIIGNAATTATASAPAATTITTALGEAASSMQQFAVLASQLQQQEALARAWAEIERREHDVHQMRSKCSSSPSKL